MKKTLVIYNSLKNDICFVKLNVDEEIKYNELDDKRLKESDENKQCQYYQDMQKIKGMTEALRWVLCGLD